MPEIRQMSLLKEKKIKNILTIKNLLLAFIVLCPILDISSFLFRKCFNTSISISTILRPIIPIIAAIYIFIKEKNKKPILIMGVVYITYAICHLYVFYRIKTACAYGNEIRELQYIINYTFMVMNLIIYWEFFALKNRDDEVKDEEKGRAVFKLRKCALVALTVYIVSMFISILTKTASYTYEETMTGYKGWFESGNSIGTIMLLLLCVVLPMLSKKYEAKYRIWTLMVTILTGVYLSTLLGTRVGLFGFLFIIIMFMIFSIIHSLAKKNKINKKVILASVIVIFVVGVVVTIFGSKTLERRKQLKNNEDLIYDPILQTTAHVTGDIMQIVLDIKNGKIDKSYMSEDMQQAYIKLYEIANNNNISNTNMRILQFIYQSELVKIQNNIPILLFGNGYMTHFYEMIFEMEVPAFLYNFGFVGFFIYFVPFLLIAVYGVYVAIKNITKIEVEGLMAILGIWFAIIVSFVSGYTFFNSSSMMVIVLLTILVINTVKDIDDEKIKIYNPKTYQERK